MVALKANTLGELFQARASLTPSREAYRQFDSRTQSWISYSWADMRERVSRWRTCLKKEGLPSGARVAILVPNSIEHVCMDQAALSLGFVPVPLHVIDNPENLAFVIADCGATVLLADGAERWRSLAPLRPRFPNLRRVLYLGPPGPGMTEAGLTEKIASCVDDWLANCAPEANDADSEHGPDSASLAAIVYTSGTTGRPKGVMLTHRNVISNVNAIVEVMALRDDDVLLSFLPLSHTFERTVGYYLPIAVGATVAFARSIPLLTEDLRAIRPTIFVSVPRIYERVYAALREKTDGTFLTRRLFALAVDLGWRKFQHTQGRGPELARTTRLVSAMLERVVGKPVRERFGGRLRTAVTGGAALSGDVARTLLALGIPVVQGYGMTESSPVIACNTSDDNDPASVGRALPGVQVRLGDQDELLTRSDSVMHGYWNRPDETARVLEPDGWLHTGDRAVIDGGRIRIKGRIKDIIVTSTGEKISPTDLEAAIGNEPLFEQSLVLGEGRPYLAALLVVNQERWAARALELGLNPKDSESLRSPTATQWTLKRIAELVSAFPAYATPCAVFLSSQPWTVANALMTPTLKPKRAAIAARYAAEIGELYRGH